MGIEMELKGLSHKWGSLLPFRRKQVAKKTMGNSLVKIIKWYATVMGIVIIIFTAGLSFVIGRSTYQKSIEAVEQAVKRVSAIYNEDLKMTKWLRDELLGSEQKVNSVQKYFDMELADYIAYVLEQDASQENSSYYFFPQEIRNVYLDNPYFKGLALSFANNAETFVSTLDNRGGQLLRSYSPPKNDVTISKVFFSEISGRPLGTFQATFDRQKYDQVLTTYQKQGKLEIVLTNETQQNFYTSSKTGSALISQRGAFFAATQPAGDLMVVGGIKKAAVFRMIAKQLLVLWLAALGVIVLLVGAIYGKLTHYQNSVNDILFFLNDHADRDLKQRLATNGKEYELGEISWGINSMMDHIDEYIVANYQLQNEQKDANMRALQAQINPHFLYNTLEYIRMYAVNIGAKELSQVVFTFSSLLRGSIIQESETTLAEELTFCEKYAYLYQMRYPSEINFAFQVEAAVSGGIIPKFIIQPLIENYFQYGIDFDREDNLIEVKAVLLEGNVVLSISDNGLGISPERLEEIKWRLVETAPQEKNFLGESIGLKNVYQRLNLYYQGRFSFDLESGPDQGTRIQIIIPLVEERVSNGVSCIAGG